MNVLRVEFIGIPAAGKTFACHAIAGGLAGKLPAKRVIYGSDAWLRLLRRRNDGPIKNTLKRLPAPLARHLKLSLFLPEFVRAASTHPGWVARHFDAIARQEYPPEIVHMLVFAFLTTLCEEQCSRGQLEPGEILLKDEGLCQRVFSVHGYADVLPRDEEIESYLDGMHLPDALVCVTTDVRECHHRLLRRPFYPVLVERRPEHERIRCWQAAQECVLRIARAVERRGRVVIPVEGQGGNTFGEAVQQLADMMGPVDSPATGPGATA